MHTDPVLYNPGGWTRLHDGDCVRHRGRSIACTCSDQISHLAHLHNTLDTTEMSTNTRPELKFFLYSDPAEAKTPDNKRLVRVHVARNSHAKTRNARTRTPNGHQAHGEEEYLQADSNELDARVVSRTPSPSIPSGSQSSPHPPEVSDLDPSLPSPSLQLPSGGPAQGLIQGLSPDERFLLDHCE